MYASLYQRRLLKTPTIGAYCSDFGPQFLSIDYGFLSYNHCIDDVATFMLYFDFIAYFMVFPSLSPSGRIPTESFLIHKESGEISYSLSICYIFCTVFIRLLAVRRHDHLVFCIGIICIPTD